MSTGVLAASTLAAQTSVGEAVTFWILAPVALGSAIALVLVRNAVHAALLLVLNLFCLAVFYAVQDAPFLAIVQVIVYAGAIMILFLFVLMLVGVDASDSLVETLRGQRLAAFIVGLGFVGLLIGALGDALLDAPSVGLAEANEQGNVVAIGELLFTRYVFAFEATSALLITAALGAMVLAHRERTGPRRTQREMSRQRFAGTHPTPLPGPGVFALDNSVETPARLPDGSLAPGSVPPVLTGVAAGTTQARAGSPNNEDVDESRVPGGQGIGPAGSEGSPS